MPERSIIEAAGYVLAGGQSSRMGTDKALVVFRGEPLIACALRTLRAVCAEVSIAGGAPGLDAFAPLIRDEVAFQGPLGGIVAALGHSQHAWNLFLPIDTPFVPAEALQRLLATPVQPGVVAVLSRAADHVNPLIALYHRCALPGLAAELGGGRLRVRAAIEAVGPVSYADFGETFEQPWFRNLNSPSDLVDAASYLTTEGR